jgi:hypothetical protein
VRKNKSETVRTETQPQPVERPEVIVDFVFREGALFVAVANVGGAAALNVAVKFDKAFRGLDGTQNTSALPLFTRLLFLAPHKSIETFLDSSSAYFARKEPTRITANVSYRDAERGVYERRIVHDLTIYKDITYVVQRRDTSLSAADGERLARSAAGSGGFRHGSEKR